MGYSKSEVALRRRHFAPEASHLVILAVFGLFFLLLNYVPLRATDLWGHVLYGDWILEHRSLPEEDPFMALAQGVPVVDAAWLSQVLLSWIYRVVGGEGLSAVFALTVLATHGIWVWIFYRQSGRPSLSLFAALAMIFVGWSRLFTIRPENFAALCWALLLWRLVGVRLATGSCDERSTGGDPEAVPAAASRRWPWISVPVVVALWANLHGSFVLAPVALGCFAAGRAVEVAWRHPRPAAVAADRTLRRWLVLLAVGGLATMINPYGPRLVGSALSFGGNENLRDILEWQPWSLAGVGGTELVASWVALALVLAWARRPVAVAYVLLLIALGAAVILGVRFIGWYAPVFALVLVTPWGATRERERDPAATRPEPPAHRVWGYTFVALVMIVLVLSLSPFGQRLLRASSRTPAQLYGDSTPLALTRYLRRHPPPGEVFHPQHWGDWLVREGPPGLRPFITMNSHLVPRAVWLDYLRITAAADGWQQALDRYRIRTVIVDRRLHSGLEAALAGSATWRAMSPPEDPQALVFVRVEPAREDRGLSANP